ncbi:MAG TPA: tRNA pseudouridine(55) synthase TruB [Stellaceae bacterium]
MPGDRPPHGWLVIDKPQGVTSAQAVGRVRRAFAAKAGHAGTLDPLATGVLPIALGEATKTIAYAINGRKRYRFRVRWGIARATDDCEGEIVGESGVLPRREDIEAVLPNFTGAVMQTPPAYCALKIGGRRSYALARAGHAPSLAARRVEIYSLGLTATPDLEHADFEAIVGKGTYIRALARDLARELGTFGHITALRRLSVGPFGEADAIPLESLGDTQHIPANYGNLLPIETALAGVPAVMLAASEADRLRYGQRVTVCDPVQRRQFERLDGDDVVSAWHNQTLVALAKIEGASLRPLRVINW